MKLHVDETTIYRQPVLTGFEPVLAYHCRDGWTLYYLTADDGVQRLVTGTENERQAICRAATWLQTIRLLEGPAWMEALIGESDA